MPDFITYTIQPTDSIRSIADRFGVSLDELVKLNPQVCTNGKQEGIEILIPVDVKNVEPVKRQLYTDAKAEPISEVITGYRLKLPSGELYEFDKITTIE